MNRLAKLALSLITAAVLAAAAPAPAGPEPSGLVNINTATASELELLPRVGPAVAARILAHRKQNGAFAALEDLLQITGIGEKTLALMRPYVRTEGETTLKAKVKTATKPPAGRVGAVGTRSKPPIGQATAPAEVP